ncbi:UDP-2,4-diacetamido-2,4,6-trideoxy-beta-L-altropyranose hydrolase [Paenibacillus agricola]|uniref:UDP-2,4-diacetamido-2,4, 6-trideoxy-beta-L-altropyranose hydrolase n=1 Tax=Paenibacillus agricola TaxID=2716264 RepID=A0ABX0JF93_9BACL|nr:UDP-2,4-diacetamido-2,4,6-trideoxy-beta-L-altropyranose hydrolase [Paenibacillus agricola]NHN33886.1 UDP-2,4-diacetamido-2,4,6-trideoxy-beta-L-altropyranose hydrolase [Paenibacillus agricola]
MKTKDKIRIAIRADSSIHLGTGHIMRCLTLADELEKLEGKVVFFCRNLPGNLGSYIREKNYPCVYIDENPNLREPIDPNDDAAMTVNHLQLGDELYDAIIVDHYSLDAIWEKRILHKIDKLLVIDDLADRQHSCSVLVDQNLYLDMESRYDNLVPPDCRKLLGPQYALIRSEFTDNKTHVKPRDSVRRVLVCFGGTDPGNETSKVINALSEGIFRDLYIDVVIGKYNPHGSSVQKLCTSRPKTELHIQANNMSELMLNSDLAICSGGTITWERLAMGLPGITIAIADNQIEIASSLDHYGIDHYIGLSQIVDKQQIQNGLKRFMSGELNVAEASQKAMQFVDGFGAKIVASILMNEVLKK